MASSSGENATLFRENEVRSKFCYLKKNRPVYNWKSIIEIKWSGEGEEEKQGRAGIEEGNKANTYKSRARLTDSKWLRMTGKKLRMSENDLK